MDAPSIDRCQQIATILDINIEEFWTVAKKERLKRFMDKEDISEDSFEVLTDAEKALINLYRSLDSDMRRDFGGMIFMLLDIHRMMGSRKYSKSLLSARDDE